ncbi:hypothetical protein FBEOM_6244 [Fusarium beomiforme]|uniref:Uncharacterized protein n=1 Tax=Fusarium beomiforme TaxID=44412 RepID=A0A9P5AJG5_9HYPO|nr:hypothetical protein FBEOM_6244 [Fusarium beomiforme]
MLLALAGTLPLLPPWAILATNQSIVALRLMTRKQKRANRRSTLRMAAGIAPFMSVEQEDEDGFKKEEKSGKQEEKEEQDKEVKTDVEKENLAIPFSKQ